MCVCVIWVTGELIKSADTKQGVCVCVCVCVRGGGMLSKRCGRLTAQHFVPGNGGGGGGGGRAGHEMYQ